jgi:hypothetical protein
MSGYVRGQTLAGMIQLPGNKPLTSILSRKGRGSAKDSAYAITGR